MRPLLRDEVQQSWLQMVQSLAFPVVALLILGISTVTCSLSFLPLPSYLPCPSLTSFSSHRGVRALVRSRACARVHVCACACLQFLGCSTTFSTPPALLRTPQPSTSEHAHLDWIEWSSGNTESQLLFLRATFEGTAGGEQRGSGLRLGRSGGGASGFKQQLRG